MIPLAQFAGEGVLRNATVPACLLPEGVAGPDRSALVSVDIVIAAGKIAAIRDPGASSGAPSNGGNSDYGPDIDLDNEMVLPALIDLHTHLDKGHIWPRKPNPDGTFAGALTAVGEDRVGFWSAEDVRTRMDFALRCAHHHGTRAIRTHLDSIPPQDGITWPVFQEIRSDWAGRIELQGVCLFGIDRLLSDPGFVPRIADLMVSANGIMGVVCYMVDGLEQHLEAIFRAAMERGLDLDFHVDETLDPGAQSLRVIAETALRLGFEGKIVCGHCCSLSTQDRDDADRTLDLVAEAGLGVVSLPMCNMYLQDRGAERTPRRRGVTLLHEMRARGIPVSVASDNIRDPFYAYGDLDLIEVYAQATRILHLDHPIGDWISTVTTAPADLMGLPFGRLKEGGEADLIVFRAREWNELLARPAGPRTVLRGGQPLTGSLPDYRELDELLQKRHSER